jgi:hypothetical protein
MKTKHITNVYIRCGRIANPTERRGVDRTVAEVELKRKLEQQKNKEEEA